MDLFQHSKFLGEVQDYIKENPEVAPHVLSAMSQGISDALKETKERAAEYESVVANIFYNQPNRKFDSFADSVIRKWRNKGSCRWDWYFDGKISAKNKGRVK